MGGIRARATDHAPSRPDAGRSIDHIDAGHGFSLEVVVTTTVVGAGRISITSFRDMHDPVFDVTAFFEAESGEKFMEKFRCQCEILSSDH